MKFLEVSDASGWRAWLEANGKAEKEVWLVFPKVHTGVPAISYDDAVEEALCFGWIDSTVRRIDDDLYARKFTPRKPASVWSDLNKARAEKAIREGRMTGIGLSLVASAKESGEWDRTSNRRRIDEDAVPSELLEGLRENPSAGVFFETLPRSCRRQYIIWIAVAVKPETRRRRAEEAVRLLLRGERLGLK
jgi:uncharacterized protein YdeI (YjbR/CyaY-like superfamily)